MKLKTLKSDKLKGTAARRIPQQLDQQGKTTTVGIKLFASVTCTSFL